MCPLHKRSLVRTSSEASFFGQRPRMGKRAGAISRRCGSVRPADVPGSDISGRAGLARGWGGSFFGACLLPSASSWRRPPIAASRVWPRRNSSEISLTYRLDGCRSPAHVTRPGSVAMFKFVPSIARCGSDEFVPRLRELRALVVSLFIMSGIATVAFVACAVLQ
jgi:hypothetical protein